ncbi:MAG: pre-peptidase C-terminal domain-containing protein, partial [Pirellulaceae bacterium]|nr:pre-peptidase C-terminal domain-containing protein [Pirellulaceae bacterium]
IHPLSNQPIPFTAADTQVDIANAIADAINSTQGFGVTATTNGNLVRLSGDRSVTFEGAVSGLGLTTQGVVVSSSIDPQLYKLDFPGSEDEPGHRAISESGVGDEHIEGGNKDTDPGVATIRYIFRNIYGTIPDIQGGLQPAFNLITNTQQIRAREIFETYSQVAGLQFVETTDENDTTAVIVATGDMRAINPFVPSGPGGTTGLVGSVNVGDAANPDFRQAIIMDSSEFWNDERGLSDNPLQFSWFEQTAQATARFLGLGDALELPPGTLLGADSDLAFDNNREGIIPGDQDIVHLQRLFRPEGKDIDLYKFTIDVADGKTGVFTAETIAERQRDSSLLDTTMSLFREIVDENGVIIGRELIARNDDYYSEDSYLEVELGPGTYYVGVSASGNDNYDPVIEDTGIGGTSEGNYDLRLAFRPDAEFSIIDADNTDLPASGFDTSENAKLTTSTPLDGDADGVPGGIYNFWFRTQNVDRTLNLTADGNRLVDGQVITVTNSLGAIRRFELDRNGSFGAGNRPVSIAGLSRMEVAQAIANAIDNEAGFSVSATAFGAEVTLQGERLVTLSDNSIGIELGGKTIFVDKTAAPNPDGSLAKPFNNIASATTINAFAAAHPDDIIRIVGNDTDGDVATLTDRQAYEIGFDSLGRQLADGGSLQLPQGVTVMIDEGTVFKLRRAHIGVGSSAPGIDRSGAALQVLGVPGNNVYFTSYEDETIGSDSFPFTTTPLPGDWGGLQFRDDIDRADGNFVYDEEGIFLNYVANADMRFGGGNVVINSVPQVVAPIEITDTRPTIAHNAIMHSADAAMSASPNSFEETNFHAPRHQRIAFTSDYARVGPDIHGNFVAENSLNGLFVRVQTPAGNDIRTMTVSGRWDDLSIVHILAENLQIAGTPSGPIQEIDPPPIGLITLTEIAGGVLEPGDYDYRLTFVDLQGNEGPVSEATIGATLTTGGTIALAQIPRASGPFVARNLYRSLPGGQYELVRQLNGNKTTYVDDGYTRGGLLVEPVGVSQRPRPDARLSIDPSMVVKLDGARIETGVGAQFIAEGQEGLELRFTSLMDDRFGGGGTFDTANDGPIVPGGPNAPRPGEWGGIYVSLFASANIDQALIAYAGGVTRVEGTFAAFNPIEVHQAEVRIANTTFENNATGQGGQALSSRPNRVGRGENEPGAIFVSGAQPTIIDNVIRDNLGAAISINVNALNHKLKRDTGRITGFIDRLEGFRDNQGPLIHNNRLADNGVNGVAVRGQTLTTQSVWDDTDIVHVVQDTIYVSDFHTYGGLRLESNPTESLVVKFLSQDRGNTDPNVPNTAGLRSVGMPHEINDRIGGIVQVVGQPRSPVVLTSLNDDTVGAGFDPSGDVQTRTGALGTGLQGNLQLVQPDSGVFATLTGNVGVSTDGLGTDDLGTLQANIPAGSAIELAILHVATRTGNGTTFPPPAPFLPANIMFEGQTVPITYLPNVADSANENFETGRVDVTGLVAARVAAGGTTMFNFTVDETITGQSNNIEGTSLTVVYSNPTLPERTVLILEGGLTGAAAQRTSLSFADPLDPNDPNFVAELALGIQYGFPGTSQFSTIDVNGQRLTSSAGAADDSAVTPPFDGNLITVGGVGDSLANPPLPFSNSTFQDDELYDLRQFVSIGDRAITIDTANPSDDDSIFLAVVLVSGNAELGNSGAPGDWRGVQFEQFSHDRNVELVTETEARLVNSPGTNSTTNDSQFLGQLAPGEKNSDENRRLGFEIQGFLNDRRDYDVYSFTADAGTEVWFDIDRTTFSLDSVVELLDSNGVVLAQSTNSFDEANNPNNALAPDKRATLSPSELADPTLLLGVGRLMQKTPPFAGVDNWSINPRDAGMRVILPGPTSTTNTYHVRIRSNSQDLNNLDAGLTSGAYQMQIRLQETDEVPGSTVRYANISYAENGIQLLGQPGHSPLLGEISEDSSANGTGGPNGNAQNIGNLVAVDRATLGIAGVLSNSADVDFFRFEVDFEDTVVSPTSFETVFDLDYADGLARANMIISVFDDTGSLILTSREANVAEDRPGNVGTSDIDDLSRGSVGASDPYIGGVELSPGDYYVAVTSDAQMPRELEQFFLVNPLNPDLRLEPINSLQRIAEDHIGFPSPQIDDGLPSTFDPPQVPILIDANSEVSFNLGDVALFVSQDYQAINAAAVHRTNLVTVDPFTGQRETTVGDFNFDTRDIAFHPNGDLFTFSQGLDEPVPCAPFDANSGNFLRINTGTGAATLINDDGILTYQRDPMDPAASIQTNPCPTTRIGDGIQINALGFGPIGLGELFGVGDRGFQNRSQAPGVEIFDNILYQFIGDPQSPNFGLGLSSPQPNRVDDPQIPEVRYEGAGTQIRERGELLTSPRIEAVDATVPTRPSDNGFNIKDGTTLTVEDGAQSVEFEFDFGFEAVQLIDGNNALAIRDGNFFQLDDDIFQLDTGPVIAVNPSGVDLRDGTVVSLNRAGVNVGNFEFTLDVMNIGGGNTPVLYALQDNSLTLANK